MIRNRKDRAASRSPRDQAHSDEPRWASLSDEELLDVRLCDFGLNIEGTPLQRRVDRVYSELRRVGLRFRPYFWLSSSWFTPDGVAGVAIPFYLAHPRLMELEERQMLEVEGGSHSWCMRLLRHEVGHAICNAYRLFRRRRWREIFGKWSEPYPDFYQPRPYSKRYVLHLDSWYAQSHPSEDFAETFAVWLTPHLQWRTRYKGWPALRKLVFVDELMAEIAGKKPAVTSRARIEPLRELRYTLREHYEEKRARYGTEYPDFYDRDLRRLFTDATGFGPSASAAGFLRRVGPQIRRHVARWTGLYQYTIDQVLEEMIARCRELNLYVDGSESEVQSDATILLTVQAMNYLHSGGHRLMR